MADTSKSDDDGAFDIVSRTGNNVLKVKKDVDKHLVDATTRAHARVINAAAEADGAFDIVSRTGNNNVLKVKKDVDAHLVDTTIAAHARVINAAAEANPPLRSAAATAITATPFLLGGLAGLAI